MKYTVYILYSNDDKYYVGYTSKLEIRVKQHNEKDSGFTKKYRPWVLIYQEDCDTKSKALQTEKYLKSLKNKDRIRQYIAGWRSSTSRGS